MPFNLTVRIRDDEPFYTRSVAAQVARISLDFLRLCEEENLLQAKIMAGGGQGYTPADIRQMARIRRLREDLELDLPAVEVALHLRRQVVELLAQIDEMERQMSKREQELLNEIQQLRRRLATEAEWR
jgi:DNA-binding transcriptional MerR regulator